ncbi:protein of unknown function (plasmid) [Cupriavidus taiwanensis]|nr:hypothetical protein CBM2598_U40037 [Cupriavidus taiwanensis]SPD37736.1 protein of unknown function [Cupriavidus taiwanensis]
MQADDGVEMKKPSTQLIKPMPSGKSGDGNSMAILPSDLGAPVARRSRVIGSACSTSGSPPYCDQ